jgi:hypothetical protein
VQHANAPILNYQTPQVQAEARRSNSKRRLLLTVAICATIASIFAEPALLSRQWFYPDLLSIAFTIGVCLPLLAWIGIGVTCIVRSVRAHRGIDIGPAWPRAIGVLFLLTLLLGVRYDRCPHATYLSYGSAMIAIGGRPCSNQRRALPILFAPLRSP